MSKLEALRAKLREMENNTGGNSGESDKTMYRFWDMELGKNSHVRFLPDKDEENTFFWVEKQMINLTFPGIKGDDENKEITIKVPCVEMWGETCPIHDEIRPWFKEPSLEETARKYWKKRSYIFQGFVINDGVNEKEPPENPIRRFVINGTLFKIIKAALLDPDMDELPCDYDNGTNFIISKEQNGKWADYGTSKYARKESALDQEQLAAIEEYGLQNLADALPQKPSAEAVAAMYEMFEASIEGDLYDPARWAKFYRPYGFEYKEDSESKPKPKVSVEAGKKSEAKVDDNDDDVPFDIDEKSESTKSSQSADDIIAMIRQRK